MLWKVEVLYKEGWNDNLSVKQYLDNAASFHVHSSAALEPLRSKCIKRVTPNNNIIVEQSFAKHPRLSKQNSYKLNCINYIAIYTYTCIITAMYKYSNNYI